jgi:hypothetical protein
MPDEQLQALSLAVEDGSWSKNWKPSVKQQQKVASETNPLLDALNAAECALISAHFAMVHLAWDDDALRQRLKPVFDITRPYVEEPED